MTYHMSASERSSLTSLGVSMNARSRWMDEIATMLDVTPNAVSIRLLRAREKLKAEIGKIEAGAGHEQSEGGAR